MRRAVMDEAPVIGTAGRQAEAFGRAIAHPSGVGASTARMWSPGTARLDGQTAANPLLGSAIGRAQAWRPEIAKGTAPYPAFGLIRTGSDGTPVGSASAQPKSGLLEAVKGRYDRFNSDASRVRYKDEATRASRSGQLAHAIYRSPIYRKYGAFLDVSQKIVDRLSQVANLASTVAWVAGGIGVVAGIATGGAALPFAAPCLGAAAGLGAVSAALALSASALRYKHADYLTTLAVAGPDDLREPARRQALSQYAEANTEALLAAASAALTLAGSMAPEGVTQVPKGASTVSRLLEYLRRSAATLSTLPKAALGVAGWLSNLIGVVDSWKFLQQVAKAAPALAAKAKAMAGKAAQIGAKAWSTAKRLAARTWDAAKGAAQRAWQKARDLAARVTDRAKQTAKSALNWGKRTAQRAWGLAKQTASKAWSWGKSRAQSAANTAQRVAAKTWEWARQAAQKAWSWARNKGRGPWEWAAQKARSAWDYARGATKRATDLARRLRDATMGFVAGKAQQAWDWAMGRAGDAWRWTQDKAGRAWDFAKSTAAGAWDKASRLSQSAWRLGRNTTRWAFDKAKRLAGAALGGVRSLAGKAWDWTKAGASKAWNKAKGLFGKTTSWAKSALGKAAGLAKRVGTGVWNWGKGAAGKAWDFAKGMAGRAHQWGKAAAGKAWDFAKSMAGKASRGFNWARRASGKAWKWGRKAFGKAHRWARGAARRAHQMGRSAARKAVGFAKSMAGRVGRSARRAFGWVRGLAGRAGRAVRGIGRSLAGRARTWAQRLGRTAARAARSAWGRMRRFVRNPLAGFGRGAQRLGSFVRRTLGGMLSSATRGLAVLSRRGGSILGRMLRAATGGAATMGRWAGSALGGMLRRAFRLPGTAGSWAGRTLGRLLGAASGAMGALDRATGGLLGRLAGRAAQGAGSLGSFVGRMLGRAGEAVLGGASRMGRFLGGLAGRLLGGMAGGAQAAAGAAGRLMGRLLGAAMGGLRRADSLTGGLLGRALGGTARGARALGGILGGLLSRAGGAATQGAQLLGGLASSVMSRLMGAATGSAGGLGSMLGRVLGRVTGSARRVLGRVGSMLGRPAARVLGYLTQRLGAARTGAGRLLGAALGSGSRAISRLRSFVGRTLGAAARGLGRIIAAQRPLASPIGAALGHVTGRLGSILGATRSVLGRSGRAALDALGRVTQVIGGAGGSVLRTIGTSLGRMGAAGWQGLRRTGGTVGAFVSGLARTAGGALARMGGPVLSAVQRAGGVVGRLAGGAAASAGRFMSRLTRPVVESVGHAMDAVGGVLRRATGPAADVARRVSGSMTRAISTVASRATGMLGPVGPVVGAIGQAARAAGATAGRAATAISTVAQPVASRIAQGVQRAAGTAGSLARSVAGRIGGFLGIARSPLGSAVKSQSTWSEALAGAAGARLSSSATSLAIGSQRDRAELGRLRAAQGIRDRIESIQSAMTRQRSLTAMRTGMALRELMIGKADLPGSSDGTAKVDPAALQEDLLKRGGPGRPLDGPVLGTMSTHLGYDLSHARVHSGPEAARAASNLQAQAFTIGRHVFFGSGYYDTRTPSGLGLMAHELTHVVQQTQGHGAGARPFSRMGGDTLEQEAQLAGQHVLARVGQPQGVIVDDYARTYETADDSEISREDQARLDAISMLALTLLSQEYNATGSALHQSNRQGGGKGRAGASLGIDALEVDVEIDLGEMSNQQAARVWARAIADAMRARQAEADAAPDTMEARKVMRAPLQDPAKPRVTASEEARKAMSDDAEAVVKNVRSWWRDPGAMVAALEKWHAEDVKQFGDTATPHLDWLLLQLQVRTWDKGTVWTRYTTGLDEVLRYLDGKPEGARFRSIMAKSSRHQQYTPEAEPSYTTDFLKETGKRQLYGAWNILKGMGTALTGIADVGLWAFWKTSGWPLKKVLEKFGVAEKDLYLTPFIDKSFDESGEIIAKGLGIDPNEQMFGGVSLKTFTQAGGQVVGGLMTAGAMGQVAKTGQALQVAGNVEKARQVTTGLQVFNVVQGLKQGEALADQINQMFKDNPKLTWKEVATRPDIMAQVVGMIGTAVGAKTSWSQAQGVVSKTAQNVGLALNAAQTALLCGAYAAVDDDPTLSPEERAKAKADIMAQIITSGALMADSVWGAKYEEWKQKRAEAKAKAQAASAQAPVEPSEQAAQPKPPADDPSQPAQKKAEQAAPATQQAADDQQAVRAATPDSPEAETKPAAKRSARQRRQKAKQEAAKQEKPAPQAAAQAMDELKGLGDWDAMLQKHGADSALAKQAHDARAQAVREICKEFGATATGTAGPASDIDITFPTEKSIHAARARMEARFGKNWERLLKASFNSDVMRAHAHLDQRLQLSPEQKLAVEARLSKTSEQAVLQRLKQAGAHSDVAKAAFKEEAARLGLHKSEVEAPHLSQSEIRGMERQQDRAMRTYEKTVRKLQTERTRGRLSPQQLSELQQRAVDMSVDITERQMRINQAYPDRYMTPGGIKGTVSGEIYGKFDRAQYTRQAYDELARTQDPKSPRSPKELWKEADRRARVAEGRAKQWKELTPHEAYQRALMERLELVEQMTKAEQQIRREMGRGAKVTREQVLQRVFERYEFSKYASRAMEMAKQLGITGFDDLAEVAKGLYKPGKEAGGTAARGKVISEEAAKPGLYLDERGRAVRETRSDIRTTVYAGMLDRAQKQIIQRLHGMVQGSMDLPDLPHAQSHEVRQATSRSFAPDDSGVPLVAGPRKGGPDTPESAALGRLQPRTETPIDDAVVPAKQPQNKPKPSPSGPRTEDLSETVLKLRPDQLQESPVSQAKLYEQATLTRDRQRQFVEDSMARLGIEPKKITAILKRDKLSDFVEGVVKKCERNKYGQVGQMGDIARGRVDLQSAADVEKLVAALRTQTDFPIRVEPPRVDKASGLVKYPRWHINATDPKTGLKFEWQIGTQASSMLYERRGIAIPRDLSRAAKRMNRHFNPDLHDIEYDVFQTINKKHPEIAKKYGVDKFIRDVAAMSDETGRLGQQTPHLRSRIRVLHQKASTVLDHLVRGQGGEWVAEFFH